MSKSSWKTPASILGLVGVFLTIFTIIYQLKQEESHKEEKDEQARITRQNCQTRKTELNKLLKAYRNDLSKIEDDIAKGMEQAREFDKSANLVESNPNNNNSDGQRLIKDLRNSAQEWRNKVSSFEQDKRLKNEQIDDAETELRKLDC
jgi:hypothetical protein